MTNTRRDGIRELPQLLVPIPKRSDLRVLPTRAPSGAVIEGLDVARSAKGLCIRLGRALIAMREQAGLSLEEMAHDLRTSIVSVRRIEEGELRLSDVAAWEELCNDEVACCPRSLVQDEALVKEAAAKETAAKDVASVGTVLAVRALPSSHVVPDAEHQELAVRLEQRAKTEAMLHTEVADLRSEVRDLRAKGRQYREWLRQLGYNAP